MIQDNKIFDLINKERKRQTVGIELIASENFVSENVLNACGSVLTNKYAEGYPEKRYYGGCEVVDEIETLAIERAKKLFGAEYANVQPHSGSQANASVFHAFLNPGDKLLGFDLSHGGHLTHGSSVNFSGKIYKSSFYGVERESGLLNYENILKIAKKEKPNMIIAGASAYSRDINFEKFREIADEVGAFLLADISHPSGLIAKKFLSDPMPHCHVVTTTTHKTLRGPRGGLILAKDNEEIHKKLNSAIFPGTQGGPLMHVIAAKALCFKEALDPAFKDYQKQVKANAKKMAATFMERGINIVSNGTENHMFLVDLVEKGLTGKDADAALGKANITVNKNAVPNDPQSPFVTSGLRIGTPAATTRGFKEPEVTLVANWICDILEDINNQILINDVKGKVIELCSSYPVYSAELCTAPTVASLIQK